MEAEIHTEEQIARQLADHINLLGISLPKVAEHLATETHRTGQQSFMRLCLAFIEKMAENYDKDDYDKRNEAACRLAARTVSLWDEDDTSLGLPLI